MKAKQNAANLIALVATVAVLFIMAMLSGCGPHRVEAKAPTDVNRETYSYRCDVKDGHEYCLAWLKDNARTTEAAAREEICTKSYVCAPQDAGRVVIYERTRK